MTNGYKLYWIGQGRNDFPILYNAVQDFRRKLDSLGMKYKYLESDGGNTWSEWCTFLTAFAQKYSNNMMDTRCLINAFMELKTLHQPKHFQKHG